jgi:hypothetical protein
MSEFAVVKARELSPEEAEVRAADCFRLDQEIKANLRAGRESMWDVARSLYEFDAMSGWTGLGFDSLGDWLADPELGMSRAHFYKLVGVYHEMAILRKIDESRLKQIEPVKVQIVLPAIKSGRVQVGDALDDAQALGRRDLRERYFSRPEPESRHEEVDGEVVVELNPTDDTPVWASDQPAQNDTIEHSGHLSVVEVESFSSRAEETIEWVRSALGEGASETMMVQALEKVEVLLVDLFPEYGPDEAA